MEGWIDGWMDGQMEKQKAICNLNTFKIEGIQALGPKAYQPQHEIFNNVVCATSKASDHLNIL